jgi:hypothetical protein
MHTIDAHEGEISQLGGELEEREAQLEELREICAELLIEQKAHHAEIEVLRS